jgi:hypothetical protein
MSCPNCKNECSIMFNVAIPVMIAVKLGPDGELEIVGQSEKPSARIPRSGVCSICGVEVTNPIPLEQWVSFLKDNIHQLSEENNANNAGTD